MTIRVGCHVSGLGLETSRKEYFRVQGFGFRVSIYRFGCWNPHGKSILGFRVSGLGFRFWNPHGKSILGFRVSGLGFGILTERVVRVESDGHGMLGGDEIIRHSHPVAPVAGRCNLILGFRV